MPAAEDATHVAPANDAEAVTSNDPLPLHQDL